MRRIYKSAERVIVWLGKAHEWMAPTLESLSGRPGSINRIKIAMDGNWFRHGTDRTFSQFTEVCLLGVSSSPIPYIRGLVRPLIICTPYNINLLIHISVRAY
jgi:hypothetical protein